MHKILVISLTILLAASTAFAEELPPDRTDGSQRDPDFERFDPESRVKISEDLQAILNRAEEQKLWNSPVWHKLLHYEPVLSGGFESEADAYEFFFSENGKTNPRSELLATVMAFYLANPEDPQTHPICHFPARFFWLSEKLQLAPPARDSITCSNLVNWLNVVQARSVSVVFATYYGSNPASMYGHTFLKLNSNRDDPLLDQALNYAATPGDVDPIRYSLYGLMGGFPGFFSMMPYHMKVREYSDLESRDLWEYELNLSEEEKRFMLLHAWELGGIYFDYYYLGENCSYHILSLIEVARPELALKDRFPGWVLPAETVKALFNPHGLLSSIEYRPSLYNQIQSKLGQIEGWKRERFSRLMESDSDATDESILGDLSDYERAELLDLSLKTYLYYKESGELEEQDKEHWNRLMRRRASLPGYRTDPLPEIVNSPPESGHGPMNVRIGAGMSDYRGNGHDSRTFGALYFRPVLHDYLGPQDGYEPYSVFEFLAGELRVYEDDSGTPDKVQLERFNLLRVESYSPWDLVRTPFSYSVDLGAEQEQYLIPLDSRPSDLLALSVAPELLSAGLLVGDSALYSDQLQERINPYARVLFGVSLRDRFGDVSTYLQPMVFSLLGGVSAEGPAPDKAGVRLAPMATALIQGQFGFLRLGLKGEYRALDGGRYRTGISAGYSFSRNQELRIVWETKNWKNDVGLSYSYYF